MENSCVIGYGVVGQATALLFGIEKHFDIDEQKSNMTLQEAAKCKFVFICLPTPIDADGNYVVSDIIATIKQIEQYGGANTYVIRSTVFPGFALHLQEELGISNIVSNPEFLTESTWKNDTLHAPFVLLGGFPGIFIESLKGIYQARLKGAEIIVTDNTTAELAKLSLNGFFSLKVIYANETYDYAKKINANYETIKRVLEAHPFGPRNHFSVWFNGRRGVHGKCLPKDSKALAHYGGGELAGKAVELNENYAHQRNEN